MSIRSVNPEFDAEAITAIYNSYVKDTTISFDIDILDASTMKKRIMKIADACPYYVCEEDGEVVGFCYAHPWKERAAYDKTLETTIYLSPKAKYRGIGRQLMERLIDECRRRGYVTLIACITAENVESCEFHEKLGFEKVSHFRKVGYKFGRFLDVVDYQLML
ncbi:MAG: GNAT family N-acetyltransferase [Muribaculaceae bacterium]|nr:GNAT family N-acetyltransferase [Muribaculaceae bacterium]